MAGKIQLNLDERQIASFASYFRSLPAKTATTARFFNRGDFYTVHGADAELTARAVFRTTSFVKTFGSGKDALDSLVLNKNQFESHVRELLLVRQYRVEVYSNPGKKSQASWVLEFKGSPGNLSQFEDILFSSDSDQVLGNSVLGVKVDHKSKTTGVALVDNVNHSFSVAEFSDDDNFSILESVIVQFGPKECVGESGEESARLKKIAERCGVMFTTRKRSDFTSEGLVQDLNRLLKFQEGQQRSSSGVPQMSCLVATSALNALVKYLDLCGAPDNFGQFAIQNLDRQRFVYLDSAAISALSVTRARCGKSGGGGGQVRTIEDLLNKCRTAQGNRLLQQWVRQPLNDVNLIRERHDIVELLHNDTILRQTLYEELLRKVPDLHVLTKKLERRKSNLHDCYRIYQTITRLPDLVNALDESSSSHPTLRDTFTDPLKDHLRDVANFREMIESTVDMDLVDKGEFLVKAEFDQDLQQLRDTMTQLEEKFDRELNRTARELSLEPGKTLKLEVNSQLGYFFRVTLKEEKTIRNNKNYPQIDTNKAGVRFRSTKLLGLNEDYLAAMKDYSEHQRTIVDEVTSVAAGYAATFYQISDIVARLDVLCSFALVSSCAAKPYVRPTMVEGSREWKIREARHPCVELADNVSYIPNDVSFDESSLFQVITGPNMGGKSTFIRSVGAIALMAHVGSFVPCEEAVIPVLDAVLARVGASDSLLKGMSTFMVEMVETAGILKMATRNSLVIIDELGRGTSTYEGCGIAWAIAQHLATRSQSFSLFATHFHELTTLADELPSVRNLHLAATTHENTFTLLYQVRPGACDRSFGLQVAQMAKFPDRVVADARRTLSQLEDHQHDLLLVESDTKRRRLLREGEDLIEKALTECEAIRSSGGDVVAERIKRLSDEIHNSDNPHVRALLRPVAD